MAHNSNNEKEWERGVSIDYYQCKCNNKLLHNSTTTTIQKITHWEVTSLTVIIFNNTTNCRKYGKKQVWFSTYVIDGLTTTYNYLSDSCHVVCPTYWINNVEKDTQLAITGFVKIGESFFNAAIRELAEELGIVCNANCLLRHDIKNNGNCYNYSINSNNCVAYNPNNHITNRIIDNNSFDNVYKKVQIVVHGDLDNIIKLFNCVNHRKNSSDTDTIKSITILAKKDISNVVTNFCN